MIKYILAMCLLFGECQKCPGKKFELKFQETIKRLELLKSNGITPDNTVDSIKIASQVITTLTGIKPNISYDYTVVYLEKDFENDTSQWSKWYQENKCKVNEAKFDSIYKRVKLTYKNE